MVGVNLIDFRRTEAGTKPKGIRLEKPVKREDGVKTLEEGVKVQSVDVSGLLNLLKLFALVVFAIVLAGLFIEGVRKR
ncbi:hypothetical protein [Palaeococcus ferrophilus]|uniref:hypothetical protein n=1 Tax=Palaeococcus ferrophilus TaxID=83868 RepID=UPI00064E964C|nr:hypothetical protein [Palaeococcus ferrophilus]